jgi:A/G-specific adenine glycosylase
MTDLSDRLLAWYQHNRRHLPWRGRREPYAIWVSEIMLQQTQVNTAIPYFERWMLRFPTLAALAGASEQEVLSAWEGLGYYGRARNLHRAAKIVQQQHGGALPGDVESLRRLPGIGRYTAAAIASIGFGRDVAALDANGRRVFARVLNLTEFADSPAGETALWELAEAHLPPGSAGDYNQALMDLGATVCLPRKPLCGLCPLAELCESRALGVQEQRPILKSRPAIPTRVHAAVAIVRGGDVLLARRPSTGLLGGLWEFPNAAVSTDPAAGLAPALEAAYGLKVQPGPSLGVVRHAYTHFKVVVHVFACQAESIPVHLTWAAVASLADYPMGRVDRQIAGRIASQPLPLDAS